MSAFVGQLRILLQVFKQAAIHRENFASPTHLSITAQTHGFEIQVWHLRSCGCNQYSSIEKHKKEKVWNVHYFMLKARDSYRCSFTLYMTVRSDTPVINRQPSTAFKPTSKCHVSHYRSPLHVWKSADWLRIYVYQCPACTHVFRVILISRKGAELAIC